LTSSLELKSGAYNHVYMANVRFFRPAAQPYIDSVFDGIQDENVRSNWKLVNQLWQTMSLECNVRKIYEMLWPELRRATVVVHFVIGE
jgi:hypothetical protein